MICEKIQGNLYRGNYADLNIEFVDIEWYETFKRIHKKYTSLGNEVGIRLDNYILKEGLKEGDILYQDENKILAVRIPPCPCIAIKIDDNHPHMLGKVCYEIGNKHGSLFWGEELTELFTPYTEPVLKMLQDMHGVNASVKEVKLNMEKSIGAAVHSHTH